MAQAQAPKAPTIWRGPRVSRACDSCYRRKIKCDGARPSCDWCLHHSIPCTFDRPPAPKKKPKKILEKGREAEVERRIEKLEELLRKNLNQINGSQETNSPKLSSRGSSHDRHKCRAGDLGAGRVVDLHLSAAISYAGIPLFSSERAKWIESCTGEPFPLEKSLAPYHQWQIPIECQSGDLPHRNDLEESIAHFFSTEISHIFPVIDHHLFQKTIRVAYDSSAEEDGPKAQVARLCVHACGAFLGSDPDFWATDTQAINAEEHARQAQKLMPEVFASFTASLDLLQGAIMLTLFHELSGSIQQADVLITMASRIIFMLGAHLAPDVKLATAPRESLDDDSRTLVHLRDLFWLLYTVDKNYCARTGCPPSLNDEHCDLTLPPGYVQEFTSELQPRFRYPGEIRLSIIKSRTYRGLYSVAAQQKTDAELLRTIRELDDDLEKWRVSLPKMHRPTLSFSRHATKRDSQSTPMDTHFIMIRLEYHHTMAMIHQASSRCKAWRKHQESVFTEGVSSSFALSVESSRSTLRYLDATRHLLFQNCFWIMVFYPITAVTTIFYHILSYPLDLQTSEDILLLENASNLIHDLSQTAVRTSFDDGLRINHLEDFLCELRRLAGCAVRKAEMESSSGGDFSPMEMDF